jgi:hypothetical protein
MSLTWVTPAGSLGSINERDIQNISLSATSTSGTVVYSLQAGGLPRGLRFENNSIKGTPLEVKKTTISRFVVRAFDGVEKKDRTFSISVEGSDNPSWATKEGLLPVGPNSTYFVLDNDKVDFQLIALDPDIPAGDKIDYYIPYNGGELPSGLTLSKTGRISGFTDPIFALDYKIYSGNFDLNLFDAAPYDLGARPVNGFDSFTFDDRVFDYFDENNFPRRLTRYYQFTVAASDGINETRRTFQIFVVSEDFLRSDNTIMQVGTGIFRADNTYIRNPIWITESNLGLRRANNYVTLYLEVFDPPSLPGYISYKVETINPEFKGVTTRLARDNDSFIEVVISADSKGEYGIPRKNQKFAVSNVYDFTDSTLGTYTITEVEKLNPSPDIKSNHRYRIFTDPNITARISLDSEIIFGSPSNVPPGLEIDTITGEMVGTLPYQPRITKNYTFTVTATANYNSGTRASTPRTFTLSVIGEIESGIEWISERLLGGISPNKDSQLYVEAESKLRGGLVLYSLVSGNLPPGLKLLSTGEIIGKVNQIGSESKVGLTRFFDWDGSSPKDFNVTFDSALTTFDKNYTFVIGAKDIFNYTESSKTFQISISSIADVVYSNMYFKVLQKKSKRDTWNDFISDNTIFLPEKIYRYGDPAFGVQDELKMLAYAGIESEMSETFVQALSRNHYKKRFTFGNVKKAVGKDQITQEIIYEVVYVDIIDPLIKNGKSISRTVELPNIINSPVLISQNSVKIDSDIPFVSDSDHQRVFPNSIKNMRSRIKAIGQRDRTYLPLWMRSIQENGFVEPGFVSAIPICFVKPGNADEIILRINNSGFDFKNIDFEVDRYIIDSIDGIIEDKYLVFPQRGEKV